MTASQDNASTPKHRLRIFLCHAIEDKPDVRKLYNRLRNDGFDPWLDEEELFPGEHWQRAIRKAVHASDVVIVCLSRASISKAGYVQKEIKFVLDKADEQPEDKIFIIPLKLEECDVPDRLSNLHYVNFFEEKGYERLLRSLNSRVDGPQDEHSTSELQNLLARLRTLEARSDPNKVIELGERILKLKPDERLVYSKVEMAYYWRGKNHYDQGEYNQAIINFTRAIERNNNIAVYYFERGKIYHYQGKYGLAISDYTKAIEISPETAEYYLERGKAYSCKGNSTLALSSYTQAIELDRNNGMYYYCRGMMHKILSNREAARHDFQKAVELGYAEAAEEWKEELRKIRRPLWPFS
jgi:tetratricopeptide (TPR) repeat protein